MVSLMFGTPEGRVDDMSEALNIRRDDKGNGIILVFLSQGSGWHDKYVVGGSGTGDVCFGSPYYDAV